MNFWLKGHKIKFSIKPSNCILGFYNGLISRVNYQPMHIYNVKGDMDLLTFLPITSLLLKSNHDRPKSPFILI